jgi:hypothetical protein
MEWHDSSMNQKSNLPPGENSIGGLTMPAKPFKFRVTMTAKSLSTIETRIKELRDELSQDPLYQELTIMEEARHRLLMISRRTVTPAETDLPQRSGILGSILAAQHHKVTILRGVELALEEAEQPLTTRELLTAITKYGATVGGADRLANLTSIVSKRADRVMSVKWKGASAWWFKDRPLPPDPGINPFDDEGDSAAPAEKTEEYL